MASEAASNKALRNFTCSLSVCGLGLSEKYTVPIPTARAAPGGALGDRAG